MRYKSGDHFEKSIFGRRSGDRDTNYKTFSDGLHAVLDADQVSIYPETRLGELLFFGVYHKLIRLGVNPSGLRLLRGSDGSGDRWHGVDGFFYLPSIGRWPVTIDLFNLDSTECQILKDRWWPDNEEEFQFILFRHKMGMIRVPNRDLCWDRVFKPPNFYSPRSRPENHFILTPYYTEDRGRRAIFCGLVADFFAKATKKGFGGDHFSQFGT